jgi:hypothetical protein
VRRSQTEIDPWDGRNGKAVRGTVPQRTANVQLTYSQRLKRKAVRGTVAQRYVKRFTTVLCVLHVVATLSSISTRSMLGIASIVSR